MDVPFTVLSPDTHGGLVQGLSNADDGGGRCVLGGHARLPLDASALLPDLEDTGVGSPKGGDGGLSAVLVGVLGEGSNGLDGLLDVSLEVAAVARVGDNISNDVEGNLLLKGDSGDSTKVIKILNVIPAIVATSSDIEIILAIGNLDLDALAANDNGALTKLAGVDAGQVNLLVLKLERGKETLEDTVKEVVELLVVDLGQVGPQDEAGLLQAGVVERQSLLASLHQLDDVRLERLRTNSKGDTAETVAGGATEVHGLIVVLDHDVLAERLHDLGEEGIELLAHGGSYRSNSRSSSSLDTVVLVFKETDHGANQVRTVLGHNLGVDTVTEGIKSSAGTADDADILLVGSTLGSSLEVLQNGRDDLLVVRGHLVGHLVGEVDETNKGSVADLVLRVAQQVDDGGQQGRELGGDEVGGTLGGVAKREHGSQTELRVLVGSESRELLKQGNDDLTRGQLVGQGVDEADGGASGAHVLLIVRVELGDDVHGLDHQLRSHVLHGLDLHAAVADSLDEESESLGSGIVLGALVGSKVNHELQQITQVGTEQSRVVGDEGVEDLKDDLVALLVLSLDGGLEDVDHGR